MKIELEAKPSYGMAVIDLDADEEFIAESGAMVGMSGGLEVSTEINGKGSGGFLAWLKAVGTALLRKLLAGETLFVNRFVSKSGGDQLLVAPVMVGDIEQVGLDKDRSITVQSTSFLGSGKDVSVAMVWGGWRMLFSGEGAFFLRCGGNGPLLINSYGAIEKVEVNGSYQVDGGHLVAFEGDLEYKIKRVGGWKATILSGEGIVLEFSGRGTLWLQTRSLRSLIHWLIPQLPI